MDELDKVSDTVMLQGNNDNDNDNRYINPSNRYESELLHIYYI